MSKVILTDCDEVLFDWAGPFEEWVRKTYPEFRNAVGCLQDHWHVEQWLGCDLALSRELIYQFNGNEEIWPFFEPLPNVVPIIEQLHGEGWKFVAITACDTDLATYRGRWNNLRSAFGEGVFDTLHCVGLASSKADILKRYAPTYWVEDKMKHASAGADAGHTSFLINYKHNEKYDDDRIIRVTDWRDIYNHIAYRESHPEEYTSHIR